jgi:hypothetical protein
MNRGRIIALATLALVFFSQSAHAQGTFIYDQQSGDESAVIGGGVIIQNTQPVGQSFTPALPSVSFVRLALADAISGNSLGATVFVNLLATSITGSVLGSTSPVAMPDNFGHGSNGVVSFFFPSTVSLTPGTVYYFQPVVLSGDSWVLGAYNTFNYSGGTAFYNGVAQTFDDVWFREGIVVPEPSTICLGIFGATSFVFIARSRRKK